MLLIKEHQDLFNAIWEEGYLTYKDEIVGFAAPRRISNVSGRSMTGSRTTVQRCKRTSRAPAVGSSLFKRRATSIASADIMALPYPDEGSLDLSANEQILVDDVVRYWRDFVRTR